MGNNIGNHPRKFRGDGGMSASVAETVTDVLRREFGPLRHAAKLVARAARATPRTAEAWLAGLQAPQGEHIVNLMAECDALAEAINNLVRERRGCSGSSLNSAGVASEPAAGRCDA